MQCYINVYIYYTFFFFVVVKTHGLSKKDANIYIIQ